MLGNDTDADSDPLTAVLNTSVSHGTLSLASDGSFTYTPTGGYSGPDSFTYHANDGTDNSNVVTVSLTVTPAAAATYYVDKTNGSCSDSGPGTTAQPFCTIGKAASLVTAGQTVRVLAGAYAETVNGPNSGTAGNPITYSAAPGVTVTGNGTATGNAFRMSTKSYIVIDGFTIKDTVDYGIYASASDHITISNNDVSSAGSPASGAVRAGIFLTNTDNSTVTHNTSDHNSQDGIRLTGGSSGNVVSDNVSYGNAEEWERNATGIQVTGTGSDNNTILHNTTYGNEDSGLQFYAGAQSNIVVGNLSYGNGDHGIDNNAAPNNTFVGNTVQGNVTAGINLEGSAAPGSGGATLANNISVDNGLRLQVGGGTASGQPTNVRVDAASVTGTTMDYDEVYLSSGSGMIQWNGTTYASLAAFKTAVSGQETHGLEADPKFKAPAAVAQRPAAAPFNVAVNAGDYHLTGGSPAIDSADSGAANEPTLDLDGHARVDDPATTNAGAGARTYDDRGAYEFVQAANGAPDAPSLNAPANGATGIGTSPTLSIGVSDPDLDSLTVTYFGRPLASGNFAQIAQHTGVASGGNDTATWPSLGAGQTFEWYTTVSDGTHTTTGPTWTFHTTPSSDPVFVGTGDIATCSVSEDTATGNVIKGIDGTVFTVGDNVYESGTAAEFTNCYATTPWGDPSVKSRTRPAPGNHDWGNTGTASDNLSGYFGYFGAAATDANGKSYYSYDIPASNWHIVVLDSECEDVAGGCTSGSPQELWLKADLAANAGKNVIAIWHKPRYSSGATQYQAVQPLWDDLYAAGVDILLDGHDHVYERTAPEKSGPTLSSPPVADPAYGIRQFTVGTGGEGHHGLVTPLPTSEVRDDQTFGIFKLTLHASSYDWKFLPIDGSTFTDSGTGTVHGAPVPPGLTELQAGDSLTPGSSIASPNGQYRLTMQGDGNLVEYDGASVVWASGTNPGGAIAVMQSDGNFVINNSSGDPLWASDTSGNTGAYVVLGNAGEFGVRSAAGVTLWAPGRLSAGDRLLSGRSLYSPAGRFRLTMQGDGNLVEYDNAGLPVWASGTGTPGARTIVQDDGNVVVYDASNQALWATDTSGHPGAYLRLNDLGQLTVASATGAPLWAGPGELAPDTKLTSGQSVFSPAHTFRLTLQSDGNLVEYDAANTVVFATGTSSGSRLAMQGDGNLVLYDSANHVLWTSNTSGNPGAYLTLLDTGQLLVNGASGAPIWGGPGSLLPNATLASGQSASSPTGAYQLTMQAGGNLVLHHNATVVWSSGTSSAGAHALLQGDGNLVVYSTTSQALWATNTDGNPGAYLVVTDDGKVSLLSAVGGVLWSAG